MHRQYTAVELADVGPANDAAGWPQNSKMVMGRTPGITLQRPNLPPYSPRNGSNQTCYYRRNESFLETWLRRSKPALTYARRILPMNSILRLLVICLIASFVSAQEAKPTLYIAPNGDGFDVYLAAAMSKKEVPVTVVDKPENATYTLKSAQVEIQKESTGSKVTKCLFLYCAGINDKGNTSVQLVKDGTVQWSYSVNKGRGEKNRQSMAEAVAKHLKSDFFHK
jgi:hypothetical protein